MKVCEPDVAWCLVAVGEKGMTTYLYNYWSCLKLCVESQFSGLSDSILEQFLLPRSRQRLLLSSNVLLL
jgi:hypothetical protein